MTLSGIDWTVMWKLFHYHFFCTYLVLGIPIRFFAVRRFGSSNTKTTVFVAAVSFLSSILATWLPIAPIISVGVLGLMVGAPLRESLLISVPLVAVSMSIQTGLLDAVLFRMVFKESVKKRFTSLLIANILNASTALTLELAWAYHHMPTFLAAVV